MVYEEKFISKYNVPALKAVGWEGTFGFLTLATLLIPFYFVPGNIIDFDVKVRIHYHRESKIPPFIVIMSYLLQLVHSLEIQTRGMFWKMYMMDYINLHITKNLQGHFHSL